MIAHVLLCICSDMLHVGGSSLQSSFPYIFVCWTCVAVPRALPAIGERVKSIIFINHILCTSLSLHTIFILVPLMLCGPDSIVGIATGYGLDSPGIESRWGQDFLHLSRPALGPTQSPVQWVLGLSQG